MPALKTYSVLIMMETGLTDEETGRPILKQIGNAIDIRTDVLETTKKRARAIAEEKGFKVRAVSVGADKKARVICTKMDLTVPRTDGMTHTKRRPPRRKRA